MIGVTCTHKVLWIGLYRIFFLILLIIIFAISFDDVLTSLTQFSLEWVLLVTFINSWFEMFFGFLLVSWKFTIYKILSFWNWKLLIISEKKKRIIGQKSNKKSMKSQWKVNKKSTKKIKSKTIKNKLFDAFTSSRSQYSLKQIWLSLHLQRDSILFKKNSQKRPPTKDYKSNP